MKRATTLNPLFYKLKQLGYTRIFRNAVTKSQKVLVPSNFVRDQLVKDWKVSEDKIIVTYEGVDKKIIEIANNIKNKNSSVLQKFHIDQPYIFYIGNAHPHKNVEGLIKAFLKIKDEFRELKLVLAGNDHYFWKRIFSEFKDKDIIYTGYISDEELIAIYKNAKCFVMPSFEEGFGIPILEAFASGCPVVSSNRGSLKEVGGKACLYFDPGDLTDMVEKISSVIKNEERRSHLISEGLNRYKDFDWKKLAEQTLGVYKKCV